MNNITILNKNNLVIFLSPILTLFLIVLFSDNAFSVVYEEELSSTIRETSPNKRRVIIDRGELDDINQFDIANFYHKDVFLFRAVVLKTSQNFSEWYIVRTYNKYKIRRSLKVNLKSKFPSFHKNRILNFKDISSFSLLDSYLQKRRLKNNVLANMDDSNQNQLNQVSNPHKLQIDLSPISIKSIDDEYNYFGKIFTSILIQKDRRLNTSYDYYRFQRKDHSNNVVFSGHKNKLKTQLELLNFFKQNRNYLASLSFRSHKEGLLRPIHYEFSFSPFGLKNIFEKDPNYLFISYTPALYFQKRDSVALVGNQKTFYAPLSDTFIRHSLRLYFMTVFKNGIKFVEDLNYRPLQKTNDFKLVLNDAHLEHAAKLSYSVNEFFSIAYTNMFIWDKRRKSINNYHSTEWINSLSLNFKTNF